MNKLCELNDIPQGKAIVVSLEASSYVVYRSNKGVHVYLNRCPHLQVPLNTDSAQLLDDSGSLLQCDKHGALFVVDSGRCVSGPCEGKRLTQVAIHLDESNTLYLT